MTGEDWIAARPVPPRSMKCRCGGQLVWVDDPVGHESVLRALVCESCGKWLTWDEPGERPGEEVMVFPDDGFSGVEVAFYVVLAVGMIAWIIFLTWVASLV